jgi:RHS repeat-associated protein
VKEHVVTKGEARVVTKRTLLWAGWLPLCEVLEKTGQPMVRRWFQWGPDLSGTLDGAAGIGGLVAIHEEDRFGVWKRTLLPITDGTGNITAVLDAANGSVVAQYEFGPFGEPISETGEADACPFRWQSKYYDRETQLYCFPKRYYDSRTGRWLSRDPLGEAGGFNLYAYCGNDPVNRFEPTSQP